MVVNNTVEAIKYLVKKEMKKEFDSFSEKDKGEILEKAIYLIAFFGEEYSDKVYAKDNIFASAAASILVYRTKEDKKNMYLAGNMNAFDVDDIDNALLSYLNERQKQYVYYENKNNEQLLHNAILLYAKNKH